MIATQHAPRNALPSNSTRTKNTGLMSSITQNILGSAHYDNAKFEAAIKRCIPSEFVLIASQDANNQAQEDFFAMENYGMKPHVPKYVLKANAGACATTALLQLMYENPERVVADKCRRARLTPLNVLEVSREIKQRVKRHSKLDARPTISSSRPLGPPRLDKNEHAPFYVVPPGKTGTRRALLIGVISGQGPDLKGPPNDITNIQQFLERQCGFQRSNITVLQDFWDGAGVQKPTKRNILAGFQKLVRLSRPGDVCFVQFSGHGGRIGNQLYICPSDYKKAGQVSDEMIMKDLIKAMPGNTHTTMLVDCCYSGTVGDLPYVLQHNKKQQQIDAYYDTDMRKDMLRKEAENAEAYQQYKQARAEKRLMGRLADVAAAVANTATAAGKATANAALYTGKTAATAVTVTGKTAATAVTATGKATANAAIYTGKMGATAVTVTGKTAAATVTGTGKAAVGAAKVVGKTGVAAVSTAGNAAAYTGKTAAATVTGTGKVAVGAAKAVGKTGITATKVVGKTGKSAVSTAAAGLRGSANAANAVASAASAGLRGSASAATAGLRGSANAASAAAAGLRNSTGGIRRVKSAEPAFSASVTERYNYYDDNNNDDDEKSVGSANSTGSGSKKKGFKRVLPGRFNTTGAMPSTKPAEPRRSSQEFDTEDDPSSRSPTRAQVGNARANLATIGRRRSFYKKEEMYQNAMSQSRRQLMESQVSLDPLELEDDEDPNTYYSSSTYGRRNSNESTCSSKGTARTSAMSLSSFLSGSSSHGQPEDDDQSKQSSMSSSSGKRSSRAARFGAPRRNKTLPSSGSGSLDLSCPTMTMNKPPEGDDTESKRSSFNVLKRAATKPMNLAGSAASTLRRSATATLPGAAAKKAAKEEDEARKEAVERSRREAMEARQQAAGGDAHYEDNNKSLDISALEKPNDNFDHSGHKRSSLSNAFKRTATGPAALARGAGFALRRSGTLPKDAAEEIENNKSSPAGLDLDSPAMNMNKPKKASSKLSNSFSAFNKASKGTGGRFRRSNTASPPRKKGFTPFRRSNTADKASIPVHKEVQEERAAPAVRRGTVVNIALAMEAEQAARNEALEHSRQQAQEARRASRGRSPAAPKPREADEEAASGGYSLGPINKRRMTAINRMLAEDEEEEAQRRESGHMCDQASSGYSMGTINKRRMTAINRMLAEDEEEEARRRESGDVCEQASNGYSMGTINKRRMTAINRMMEEDAQEDARRESAAKGREKVVRPRKSVLDLAMAFENNKSIHDDEEADTDNSNEVDTKEAGDSNVQQRKSLLTMLAEEAMDFDASEADLTFDEGAADESQAISSITDDSCMSSTSPPTAPRKSVVNFSLPLEEEEEDEYEEDMEEETDEKPTEELGLLSKRPSARRSTAVNLVMAAEAEEEARKEAMERSRREAQEAREAARRARNGGQLPKSGQGRMKESPIRPRKSVLNMAMVFESGAPGGSEETDPEPVPTEQRKSVVNFSLPLEDLMSDSEDEYEEDMEEEKTDEKPTEELGLLNKRPSQRRSTAVNLAMAAEAEEAARNEAMERSRREAQEAREAAKKARVAKEEKKGLANDRPAQRRSTAINLAMAIEAEEAARNEAMERSRREAQEAREAARKARLSSSGSATRPAQRRNTALNFAMAMEAEETARKEALERSRREAAEARAAARRARQQRAC